MRMTAAEKSIPLTDEDINVLAESITENIGLLGKTVFLKAEGIKHSGKLKLGEKGCIGDVDDNESGSS